VLASVMRTAPMSGPTECAVGAPDFGLRKRLDGGYTIGPRGDYLVPIVPDTFKLFFKFLPAFMRDRQELRLQIGPRFVEEMRTPRRWVLDEPSPFERVRVLDPEPSHSSLDEVEAKVVEALPGFRGMKIVERWAGLIDATPDALPVISPVPSISGFFLASGFSGHGFGIGPAAGRLAADLVDGGHPIVDPTPFRFERLVKAPRSIGATSASSAARP
jgi:glycine/D-amino acid oxidase-like deaminating enzyme